MKGRWTAATVLTAVVLVSLLIASTVPLLAVGAWQTETVDSAGYSGSGSSLALDSSGRPRISYGSTSGDLKYAAWNGTAWLTETVDSAGDVGFDTSLALDSLGRPRISYYDLTNTDLKYASWNGTSWDIETVDNSAGVVGWDTSLALDSLGRPRISYDDGTNEDLKYAAWNSDTALWDIETVDSTGNVGYDTSLALDTSGRPRISYDDADNSDLKYAAWNSNTTTWDIETVDSTGNVGLFTTLVLDSLGKPRICYWDNTHSAIKYAAWNGTSWDIETVDNSAGLQNYSASLALDSSGRPRISYSHVTISYDLKYAAWNINTSSWDKETVDSAGRVGYATELALDSTGRPRICYYDGTNGNLKFAYEPPTIATVTPSSGTRGTAVRITNLAGAGFYGTPTVKLKKADSTDISAAGVSVHASGTQIVCAFYVPTNAAVGTWDLYVKNPDGRSVTSANAFTVYASGPEVSSIDPPYGPPGTVVTIAGSNFGTTHGASGSGPGEPSASSGTAASASGSYVSFNGVQATEYVSWSDTKIVCKVPQGATPGPVTVVVNGTSSNADRTFTVDYPTWYLAEGTTDYGFDTYVSIQNPNDSEVKAHVTYQTKTGPKDRGKITLPASSQTTINPREDLGATDFSTKVECTTPGKSIAVDRTMTWNKTGQEEAHCSVGVTSPAKAWYLPEGSTNWDFETWLLIQNPNNAEASCDVTYMIEGQGPKTVNHKVRANSRESFSMLTDAGKADASIKVTSSVPVIPERAMYRYNRREGHDSIGTTTPAKDYYLAEGAVGYDSGYTTYVLVQNPQNSSTDVTVTYLTGAGKVPGLSFTMAANSRKTVKVNDTLPPNMDVSTSVHGSKPIIAERAMYWNSPAGEACHDSIGMSTPASTFYLPDGQTSAGRETWTLIQNPNGSAVTVKISYLKAGGGAVTFTSSIPANSRKTFNMADKLPSSRASILVQSLDDARPVMCERSMYWNSRSAGTDTIGGYSD